MVITSGYYGNIDMKKTVVIIDDDESVRTSLGSFLEDLGWCAFSFNTAEACIEWLKEKTSEAAIIDIRLPSMDGETLLKKYAWHTQQWHVSFIQEAQIMNFQMTL